MAFNELFYKSFNKLQPLLLSHVSFFLHNRLCSSKLCYWHTEQQSTGLVYTTNIRYYGYYSNKSRGMRKKAETDDEVPALIDSDISKKKFCKNWARLIQKIYKVDPLLCPKCHGSMQIISFIEDEMVIKKILKHLNLWETRIHDPPTDKRNACDDTTMIPEFLDFADDVFSQNIYEAGHSAALHCSPCILDVHSQMTYEDDYSQLTSYEDD